METRPREIHGTGTVADNIAGQTQIAASHERLIREFTHDMKNPLGAADGLLWLLEHEGPGELSARQRERVEHARRCIQTAFDLVAQLLEIECAEAGELQIGREREATITCVSTPGTGSTFTLLLPANPRQP